MSKRLGGTLNNWYKLAYSKTPMSMRVNSEDGNDYQFYLEGIITGDENWEEGERLSTSLVVSLYEDRVETLNTIYLLGNKHEDFDKLWEDSVQALVPYVKLDIPEYQINLDYCTDIPVTYQWKNRRQANKSVEDTQWCSTYSSVNHPAFDELRKHLGWAGLLHIEDSYSNGDRVLKPFKLNNILFNEDEQFVCATAMKYHLRKEAEDEQEEVSTWLGN